MPEYTLHKIIFIRDQTRKSMEGPMETMETMPMKDTQRKLYTVVEVAAILGLGRTLVYQLVLRGEIPSIKIGRSRRIPRFAVDDFIRQRLVLSQQHV